MTDIIACSGAAAKVIDGKAAAAAVDAAVAEGVRQITPTLGRIPCLAVVLVGQNPASALYVRNKIRRAEAVGMRSVQHRLSADVNQKTIIDLIRQLNTDAGVDGILVQLPLPAGLDGARVVQSLDPTKDVDGLTSRNAGALVLGAAGIRPCTPSGCVFLARRTLGDLTGKSVVVIGRSILVGKPATLLFLAENCTVTLTHSRTGDLPRICRQADIVVAAVGRPGLVKGSWIKPGALVIDVGINRIDSKDGQSRLVGDVDFESAIETAGFITPAPGGVGPMTIAMLLVNTVAAASHRAGLDVPDPVAAVLPR